MKKLLVSSDLFFFHEPEEYMEAFLEKNGIDAIDEHAGELDAEPMHMKLFNEWIDQLALGARILAMKHIRRIMEHVGKQYDRVKLLSSGFMLNSYGLGQWIMNKLYEQTEYFDKAYKINVYSEYGKLVFEVLNRGNIYYLSELVCYKNGKPVRFTLPEEIATRIEESSVM